MAYIMRQASPLSERRTSMPVADWEAEENLIFFRSGELQCNTFGLPVDTIAGSNPARLGFIAFIAADMGLLRRRGGLGFRSGSVGLDGLGLGLFNLGRLGWLDGLDRLWLLVGGQRQAAGLAGLDRGGRQQQGGNQDQFAHVKSPLFDEGRLRNRSNRLCDQNHAKPHEKQKCGTENDKRCARHPGAWRDGKLVAAAVEKPIRRGLPEPAHPAAAGSEMRTG